MTTLADLIYPSTSPAAMGNQLGELNIVASLPAPLAAFDDLTTRLATAIDAFLQVSVHDFVSLAWDKLEAIRAARRETVGRPGASTTVLVCEQTLTTTQRPTIDIEASGTHYRLLELVVSLTLEFESIPVTVREGQIARIGAGQASASVALGIVAPGEHETHPLASTNFAPLVLPSWDLTKMQAGR